MDQTSAHMRNGKRKAAIPASGHGITSGDIKKTKGSNRQSRPIPLEHIPDDVIYDKTPEFLIKTYNMINECDPEIASWTDGGEMFVVKDPDKFAKYVIPQYFHHNKFSSFTRQLNFYQFRKVQLKAIRNADFDHDTAKHVKFHNKFFKKGGRELLSRIHRTTRTIMSNMKPHEQQKEIELLKTKVELLETKVESLEQSLIHKKNDIEKVVMEKMNSFLEQMQVVQTLNQLSSIPRDTRHNVQEENDNLRTLAPVELGQQDYLNGEQSNLPDNNSLPSRSKERDNPAKDVEVTESFAQASLPPHSKQRHHQDNVLPPDLCEPPAGSFLRLLSRDSLPDNTFCQKNKLTDHSSSSPSTFPPSIRQQDGKTQNLPATVCGPNGNEENPRRLSSSLMLYNSFFQKTNAADHSSSRSTLPPHSKQQDLNVEDFPLTLRRESLLRMLSLDYVLDNSLNNPLSQKKNDCEHSPLSSQATLPSLGKQQDLKTRELSSSLRTDFLLRALSAYSSDQNIETEGKKLSHDPSPSSKTTLPPHTKQQNLKAHDIPSFLSEPPIRDDSFLRGLSKDFTLDNLGTHIAIADDHPLSSSQATLAPHSKQRELPIQNMPSALREQPTRDDSFLRGLSKDSVHDNPATHKAVSDDNPLSSSQATLAPHSKQRDLPIQNMPSALREPPTREDSFLRGLSKDYDTASTPVSDIDLTNKSQLANNHTTLKEGKED